MTGRLRTDDSFTGLLQRLLQEIWLPPVALRVPRVYLLCTWQQTTQVSALICLAGSGGWPARRVARGGGRRGGKWACPAVPQAGRARVHPG